MVLPQIDYRKKSIELGKVAANGGTSTVNNNEYKKILVPKQQ